MTSHRRDEAVFGIDRRQLLKGAAGAVVGAFVSGGSACAPAARLPDTRRMNVLLFLVEDWNAQVAGCYGNPRVKTPAFDAFAASGVRFNRAYCQAPECSPSRVSFLTGLRPDATGVYSNRDHMAERLPPNTRTLPELLKSQDVFTANVGKYFHHAWMAETQLAAFDRLELCEKPTGYAGISTGYSPLPGEPAEPPRAFRYSPDPAIEARLIKRARERDEALKTVRPGSGKWQQAVRPFRVLYSELVGDSGVTEEYSPDGQRARLVARMLREFGGDGRQFFLSLGLEAPHVPLIAPAKYLALYPPESVPPPQAPALQDVGIPEIARRWGRNYDIFKQGPPNPEQARAAIAAYYACVSFVDAQLRIVLDALAVAGLADDTIVIVMADHGFHLGEHGMWSKLTLFEQSTRVPLVVRVPGAPANGTVCDEIVELVDLVPSLCELWSLPVPGGVEGSSFAPLLVDSKQPWKAAAFSLCNRTHSIGRSARTKRHRYADWGEGGRELYDLETDPWEQRNLAFEPEHRATAERLSKLLEAGWRSALPPIT